MSKSLGNFSLSGRRSSSQYISRIDVDSTFLFICVLNQLFIFSNYLAPATTSHECENVLIQQDQAGLKYSIPTETTICINKFHDECLTSMSDDLHTPVALAAMFEPLKTINDLLHTRKALQQLRNYALKRSKLTEDEVLQKMEERNNARKNKEYEKSDVIRKDLSAVGSALMDSPDGTSWRPTIPLALQEQLTGRLEAEYPCEISFRNID